MLRFRHMPIGSIIGTGNCIFRHYGEEQTYPNYLCFEADEDGSTIEMHAIGTRNSFFRAPEINTLCAIEYSYDMNTWSRFLVKNNSYSSYKNNEWTILNLDFGEKVYFRGGLWDANSLLSDKYVGFVMSGRIKASGSIMSLINKVDQIDFASGDPMFARLFKDCTALITAPELPSRTLQDYCYYAMFSGCSNLEYIKVGFTDWNGDAADTNDPPTTNWLYGVKNSGTFICPSELPQIFNNMYNIPHGWTVETF